MVSLECLDERMRVRFQLESAAWVIYESAQGNVWVGQRLPEGRFDLKQTDQQIFQVGVLSR